VEHLGVFRVNGRVLSKWLRSYVQPKSRIRNFLVTVVKSNVANNTSPENKPQGLEILWVVIF